MKILSLLFSLLMVTNIPDIPLEKINPPQKETKYKTNEDTIYILNKKQVEVKEWLKESKNITITRIITEKDEITVIVIIGEIED